LAADYADSLASDKGGPENMSEAEKRMVELAQLARGCTLLVLAEAAKNGGLVAERKEPDLPAALGRFMAIEATRLKTLGLARRPRPALRLREYVAGTEAAKTAKSQDPPPV
jgi:hypothetical protein